MHRIYKESGINAVVHGSNVMPAYSRVKKMAADAKLKELERRYIWNIKPKHRRQMIAQSTEKAKKRRDFQEKLSIAMELMEQEQK